jgi:proteasome assembly chaperone (PAC2) family protein
VVEGPAGAPRYVHIVDDVPEFAAPPVLLVSLEGFLDAGSAGRLAADHLLEEPAGRVVASFEIDAFYDYRARRPSMSFVEDHYEKYQTPRLVVRLEQDSRGTSYLILSGPEPDTHWEAFCRSVREVVDHFGVRLVVSLGSVPMAVPHTRPVMLTNHATRRELLIAENVWRGEIRIPSSAMSLLELRLGEWGYDAMGFVAHVPHYLAQVEYPAAAVKLLESVEVVTGLEWDLETLTASAEVRKGEIAGQIADSAEVAEVVAGLEQQYDAFHRPEGDEALPLAQEGELPTAEELGAEFERFLAGLDPDTD